jgi:hypothetical protein
MCSTDSTTTILTFGHLLVNFLRDAKHMFNVTSTAHALSCFGVIGHPVLLLLSCAILAIYLVSDPGIPLMEKRGKLGIGFENSTRRASFQRLASVPHARLSFSHDSDLLTGRVADRAGVAASTAPGPIILPSQFTEMKRDLLPQELANA